MNKLSILIGLFAMLLMGCEKDAATKISPNNISHVQGIVADRDGPVTKGKVSVTDNNGNAIATITLNGTAAYSVDLPANTAYPVLLACAVADELLEAVIIDNSVQQQDLTHMSSLVVRSARDLGGITKANMARAAGNAIAQSRTSNSTSTSVGFNGDPTKQYGGWH